MIILIAGASHTGKTVLAQRLLEKYEDEKLYLDKPATTKDGENIRIGINIGSEKTVSTYFFN